MQIKLKPQYFSMLRELWNNYTSIASDSYEYMNSKTSYINEFYIYFGWLTELRQVKMSNFMYKSKRNRSYLWHNGTRLIKSVTTENQP